jgi:hypothetical protein
VVGATGFEPGFEEKAETVTITPTAAIFSGNSEFPQHHGVPEGPAKLPKIPLKTKTVWFLPRPRLGVFR